MMIGKNFLFIKSKFTIKCPYCLRKSRVFLSKKNQQSGQTLVEFMLLLLVVTSLSFLFTKIANKGIADAWLTFIKLIVDDPTVASTINFP